MTHFDLILRGHKAYFMGYEMPVAIGRGGIGKKIGEGDGITPRGQFQILDWYYRADRLAQPNTDAKPIAPNMGWCDEANHKFYNQPIERFAPISHETMFRADPLYDIVGVIDFNLRPIEARKGSAIFLHAWRAPRFPTEGCVALAPSFLEFVAQNWQPRSRLMIES